MTKSTDAEFIHRRLLTLDIVKANKGEEPFISKEAFTRQLNGVFEIMSRGQVPDRGLIVQLMASHHWDSFEQRRVFKNQAFGILYSGMPASSELNDMPLHSTETTQAEPDELEDADTVPADMLGDMLMQQRQHMIEYQQKYHENGYPILHENMWGFIGFRATQDAIRQTNLWLIEELMEAQNLLKAKPWKSTVPLNTELVPKYHKEIGDAIHFFLELLIYSGLDTPEKVWEVYNERSANNTKRRATDY